MNIDKEISHADEAACREAGEFVALLTPVIKAFLTDNAFEGTNMAMHIYGRHGFISEWGMEQYVRDARINMIYEGTNSIQALDLLERKILGDMGAKLKHFGKLVAEFVEQEGVKPEMQEFINPLADIGEKVQKLTMEIGMKAMQNPDEVGAAAVLYLRTVGHLVSRTSGRGWRALRSIMPIMPLAGMLSTRPNSLLRGFISPSFCLRWLRLFVLRGRGLSP